MGDNELFRRAGCSTLLTPRGRRFNDLAEELVELVGETGRHMPPSRELSGRYA
jgi:hypothetical protein